MRKTIHKLFWIWDFDREEKWLNEMASIGLALVSVGLCKYEFEDSQPGEYKVCLQLLENLPSHPESQKYIAFLESTGAEHIGSCVRWAYFRKKASEGDFALFSDHKSRIKQLSLIISMVAVITAANLIVGISNVFLASGVGSPVNYLGVVNTAIGIFGTVGTIQLLRKRKRLKQEGQVFE